MPKTMREQLEESFEKAQKETGGPGEDAEEPLGDTTEEEIADSPEEGTKEGKTPDDVGDESDDKGGEEDDGPSKSVSDKPDKPKTETPPESVKAEEDLKAPVSWKPGIREHWKKLPKEVQTEIHRREAEINRGLQQASGHRKLAEEYVSAIRPFEGLIRAQNSTPYQAVTNLMQTAARLTMGSAQEKAKTVSEIIKNYGVDIPMLDQVLSGEKLPDDPNAPLLRAMDERLKPIKDFMTTVSSYQETESKTLSDKAEKDLEAFKSDPKHEFFEDVREDMADLMDLAAKRGRELSLEDAYQRACQNSPDISKILQQREAARRANRPSQEELDKKRRASSSLRQSPPAGKGGEKGGDLRSTIADAWDDQENIR